MIKNGLIRGNMGNHVTNRTHLGQARDDGETLVVCGRGRKPPDRNDQLKASPEATIGKNAKKNLKSAGEKIPTQPNGDCKVQI